MFKCGEKCTGVLAADARLVREKVCYREANKANDLGGMKRAAKKIKATQEYIKLMEEWAPAVNLAIGPAVLVARIRPPVKRAVIMHQVERAQETGINPMTGKPLNYAGVTRVIIEYLIAKHDKVPFAPEKRFVLTKQNVRIIKSLMDKCQGNAEATEFLQRLTGTA